MSGETPQDRTHQIFMISENVNLSKRKIAAARQFRMAGRELLPARNPFCLTEAGKLSDERTDIDFNFDDLSAGPRSNPHGSGFHRGGQDSITSLRDGD